MKTYFGFLFLVYLSTSLDVVLPLGKDKPFCGANRKNPNDISQHKTADYMYKLAFIQVFL